MNNDKTIINQIFPTQLSDTRYSKLGLGFNPFPKSGTANIGGSDHVNVQLVPIEERVLNEIVEYLKTSLNPNPIDPKDRFLAATVTGDYGSGKTQVLLFVKALLLEIAENRVNGKQPYVVYVDNPGVNLLEFIGTIISKIGEEDFRKLIWAKIIRRIRNDDSYKKRLQRFVHTGFPIFADTNPDPYAEDNSISYKTFLNSFLFYISNSKTKREFEDVLKTVLVEILELDTNDSALAQYLYECISSDFGVNKTWEALSAGTIKQLARKESKIIGYVVELIREQGFTDFFILVDEFEDLTEGRLTKMQIDNYVYNLRTLLDEQRHWCLLFAMTGFALKKLKGISPPLGDRISGRLMNLGKVTDETVSKIVTNYLNLGRKKIGSDTSPFELTALKRMNELVDGNSRKFLRNCYSIVEMAADNPTVTNVISADFVSDNIGNS